MLQVLCRVEMLQAMMKYSFLLIHNKDIEQKGKEAELGERSALCFLG